MHVINIISPYFNNSTFFNIWACGKYWRDPITQNSSLIYATVFEVYWCRTPHVDMRKSFKLRLVNEKHIQN